MRHILAFIALGLAALCALPAWAEQQSFEDPTFGRYRLDYCRFPEADCGILPARAFCIREGFDDVVSFRGERNVLESQRIGDRGTCQGRDCDGFAEIVCTRADPEPIPEFEPPEDGTIAALLGGDTRDVIARYGSDMERWPIRARMATQSLELIQMEVLCASIWSADTAEINRGQVNETRALLGEAAAETEQAYATVTLELAQAADTRTDAELQLYCRAERQEDLVWEVANDTAALRNILAQ